MLSWASWYTLIISGLGRLRQEDQEFRASLGCIVRPCVKKKNLGRKEGKKEEQMKEGEQEEGREGGNY
jgi:hypothetical protein